MERKTELQDTAAGLHHQLRQIVTIHGLLHEVIQEVASELAEIDRLCTEDTMKNGGHHEKM